VQCTAIEHKVVAQCRFGSQQRAHHSTNAHRAIHGRHLRPQTARNACPRDIVGCGICASASRHADGPKQRRKLATRKRRCAIAAINRNGELTEKFDIQHGRSKLMNLKSKCVAQRAIVIETWRDQGLRLFVHRALALHTAASCRQEAVRQIERHGTAINAQAKVQHRNAVDEMIGHCGKSLERKHNTRM
jgi:hypothetical protein